jgi:DNA-binding IclR family transcriptional regulator
MAVQERKMTEARERSNPNAIQVIARAADILRLVANEGGLTLGDIAKRVGLPRSTIQRIIKALRDEDFVAPGANNLGIVLGDGLRRLAGAQTPDVAEILKPLLEDLAARVDDTVDLSTLVEHHAVFIEHIAGTHRLAALSAVGERFPLHSTANGKALLACLPVAEASRLLQPQAGDRARLLKELEQVRATGLAFDIDEHTPGVSAIGTAFLDSHGRPYAISIPIPSARFAEKRQVLEARLLESRGVAARLTGGR